MGQPKTYNPKQVVITLGASHIVTGYSDDSFIAAEPEGDGTSYHQGADGEVVVSVSPNDCWKISLKLQQTSPTNKWLQTKADKMKKDGKGFFPILVQDLLGKEELKSNYAWVSKPAKWERGKDQKERDWEIIAAEVDYID